MIKIELTDDVRSDRKPWAWTDLNEARAADILAVFNGLKEWWPIMERGAYYQLISSPRSKQDHWRQFGNPQKPFVKDLCNTMGKVLKWMRIDERLPWTAIIDEHRTVTAKLGFENTREFIEQELGVFLEGYGRCMAQKQDRYIEIWIEKAALLHIVKPIADQFCRRVIVCRGYNSVTFQADFYKRATEAQNLGQIPTVLYFGDWDPSGWNMLYAAVQTLIEELDLWGVEYYRCGVNPDQFKDIPADPVPVKPEDKRSKRFIKQHGTIAYELDAFHPQQLQGLVRKSIEQFTDMNAYKENEKLEAQDIEYLVDLKDYMIDAFNDYVG
jgi:hypothetical protein